MRLLLCTAADQCANWLAVGLTTRGTAVEVVTADMLIRAPRLIHRIGTSGVDLEIDLADGRHIASQAVTVVVNRLDHVPMHLLAAAPVDVAYATQELHALWLSWLEGLPCRVLNRPSPMSLSGAWLSNAEWILHAGRHGLPTTPLRLHAGPAEPVADHGTMLVAVGSVFGPPEAGNLSAGALALAQSVGVDLLELRLGRDERDVLCVVGASVLPDLRPGGTALLDHLSAVLM